VTLRIVKVVERDRRTQITLAGGTNQGIDRSWRGVILVGTGDRPLDGGEVSIVEVTEDRTEVTARVPAARLSTNRRIYFTAP
jgi:hypothetical protein